MIPQGTHYVKLTVKTSSILTLEGHKKDKSNDTAENYF